MVPLVVVAVLGAVFGFAPAAVADPLPQIQSVAPIAADTVRITGVDLDAAAHLELGVGDGAAPSSTASIRVSPDGSPDPAQDPEVTIVEWTPTSVTFSAPALFATLGRHLYDARTSDGNLWVYRTPPNTLYVPAVGEPLARIAGVFDGGTNWITIIGQDLTSLTSLTLHLGDGTVETGAITVTPGGSPDPVVDAGLDVLNWGDESIALRTVGLLESRGQYVHRVESALGITALPAPVKITLPADLGAAVTLVESPRPYVVRVWGPAMMQAPSLSIDIGPAGGPTMRITARVDGSLLQPGEVLGTPGSSDGMDLFDVTLTEAMIAAAGGADVSRVVVPFLLIDHVVDPPVHVISGAELRPTITSVTAPGPNTIVIEGSGFENVYTASVWAGTGGFDLIRPSGSSVVVVREWTDTRIEATVTEEHLDQIGRVFDRVEVRRDDYQDVSAEFALPPGFRIGSLAESAVAITGVTAPAPNTMEITGSNLDRIQSIDLSTGFPDDFRSVYRPDYQSVSPGFVVEEWTASRVRFSSDTFFDTYGRTHSVVRYASNSIGTQTYAISPPLEVLAPVVDDDSDDDGIADAVDDPGVANGFLDADLTPSTVGVVVDASGLMVTVTDAVDPDGVRIVVGAGTGQVTLSVCGGFTLKVNPGSDLVLTCASVHLEVAAGQAQIIDAVRNITITVPAGASAAIDRAPNGLVVDDVTGAPVTVTVGGTTITVLPGSDPVLVTNDTTAPSVTVTGVVAGGVYRNGAVTPGCITADAGSGVATPATLTVTGGRNGIGTLTARCAGAVDNAGNAAAPVAVTYTVVRNRLIEADDDDIRARPGETLDVGYALRINGRHPATTLRMVGTLATFTARCSNGRSAGTITVPIADATYQVAARNVDWLPAPARRDRAIFQGSVAVPDLCNGGTIRLRAGELRFGLWSNQDDDVRVRWLHRVGGDVADWSDKERIIPG